MKPPFIRSAYNYDMFAASDESALTCLDPTMAQQSQAEDCDINVIVKRFGLTGLLPVGVIAPTYGDLDHSENEHEHQQASHQKIH